MLQPLAAEVIEPDLDTGLAGVLGEAAVIEEQLINADLDVHRRQARQAGVKRAGVRILRAAAFAEEDARQRLDRFLALNQRILALLDGSDPPVYSMSTHGENGIAAAGRAPVQAPPSPAAQPGKTPAADRQFPYYPFTLWWRWLCWRRASARAGRSRRTRTVPSACAWWQACEPWAAR